MSEQDIAKNKALEIIQSCFIINQLESAKMYLDLYLETFKDENSYNELMSLYKEKYYELSK